MEKGGCHALREPTRALVHQRQTAPAALRLGTTQGRRPSTRTRQMPGRQPRPRMQRGGYGVRPHRRRRRPRPRQPSMAVARMPQSQDRAGERRTQPTTQAHETASERKTTRTARLDATPGGRGLPGDTGITRRIAPPVVHAPEIPVFPPASFSAGLVPFAPPVAVSSARWGLPRSRDAFLAVRLSPLQAMSRYE